MIQKGTLQHCLKHTILLGLIVFLLINSGFIYGCTSSSKTGLQNQTDYQIWAKEYAPAILHTLLDAPASQELTCYPTVPVEKNNDPGTSSSLFVVNYGTGESLEAPTLIPPVDSHVAMDAYRAYYKSSNSIVAVELSSGTVVWDHDFSIEWPIGGYRAPVLYKDWVIYVTMVGWPKGTAGCIVAMNKETGETAWRYQTDDPMSYWLHIQNDTLYFFQEKLDSSIGDYTSKMVALDLPTQERKCEITIPGSLESNDFYPTQYGILVETFMDKFDGGNIYLLDSQTGESNVVMQPSQKIIGSVLAYADDSVYICHHDEMAAFSVSSGELLWNYTKPQEVTGERPLICKIDSSVLGFFYDQQIVMIKQDTGEIVKIIQMQALEKESKQNKEAILSLLQDLYFALKEEEVVYSTALLHLEHSPKPPVQKLSYPSLPLEWDYEIEVSDSWKISPSSLITVFDNQIYLISDDTTIQVFDLVTGNILQSKAVPYSIHSKLVVDDTAIYYKDNQKTICALNRETLEPLWTHTLPEEEWTGHLLEDVKLVENKLFVVTYTREAPFPEEVASFGHGNVIALNTQTGEEEWRFSLPKGYVDSELYVFQENIFFAHYDGESSTSEFARLGWYGGTVYCVNGSTLKVTSIQSEKSIFTKSIFSNSFAFYSFHQSGMVFKFTLDGSNTEILFRGSATTYGHNDWKPLQYVNDTILIRGVGPMQCYELSTMERKWTCVLPHQLQVVSNAIEWGKNQILVSDENSNFHVIDIQTGKIVKSYSAETPCWMPLKQSILPINNKLVVTTRESNRVFLRVLSLN